MKIGAMKIARLAMVLALALAAVAGARAGEPAPFVRGTWAQVRRAHENQAVVVHFWGLSCAPCLAELPEWARLTRERADLRLILVHAEASGEPERIGKVLARAGLEAAENWSFADPFEERLRYEIDPQWRGELPRTLLIGADGVATPLSGPAGFGRIVKWLDAQPK